MTWQLAGTTATASSTAAAAHWEVVLDTYLSTRTGFTVADHPANANYRQISYTANNLITDSSITWWYVKYNNAVFGALDTYTSTPGDNTTVNSPYSNWYNSGLGTGEVFRVWYSTENARDILVTFGKKVILWWGAQADYWAWPGPLDYSWPAGTKRDTLQPMPAHEGKGFGIRRSPMQSTGSSSTYYGVPLAFWTGWSTQASRPMLFSAVSMVTTSDTSAPYYPSSYSVPYMNINQADVKYHCPASGASLSSGNGFSNDSSETNLLVLYQSNYYLRMDADVTQPSWMLDFGTTEPDFSLLA